MPNISWNKEELEDRKETSSGIATGIDSGTTISQGYQHGSLTKGLVAYYPMEKGQGNVLLDGALGNHGQINGASWNGSGQIGNDCLSFDGSGDNVDIGSPSIMDDLHAGTHTIASWIYTPILSSSKGYGIFGGFESRGSTAVENSAYIFRMNADSNGNLSLDFQASFDSQHTRYESNYGDLPSDSWVFVTAVFDSSTKDAKLYIDGTEPSYQTANTGSGNLISNKTLDKYIGDNGVRQPFDGLIEDVRIYNRALSKPEIQALANLSQPSGHKITDTDVPNTNQSGVSRYKFNGNVNDSWGTNDGTDQTDVSPSYVTGVHGQAKNFDGNDDYVESQNSVDLSSKGSDKTFSLSGWVKANETGTYDLVLSHYNSNNDSLLGIQQNQTDWEARLRINGTEATRITTSSINTKNFNHLYVDVDTSQYRLFVNGNIIGVQSHSLNLSNFGDGKHLSGGRPSSSDFLAAKVDDFRTYNTALTPQQIEQLYQLGAHKINRGDTVQ